MSIAAGSIVIHAGTLLADPSQGPQQRASIHVKNGKVAAVSAGFIDPPQGAELIDLKDKFVLPGLIDCHVHLTGQFGPGYRLRVVEDSDVKIGLNGAYHAKLTLKAGFTTVRDVGALGHPDTVFALRSAIAEGKVPGPRMLCVGTIISPTGGHGQTYGYREDVCACVQSHSGTADGVDDCRRAVRRQVSFGADAIKFVATGGVLSNIKAGIDQQFTDDEIRTIIETAHGLGRRVCAHAHGAGGINAALRNGVDSIEHGSFLDEESIRLFLDRKAYHVPTIIAGMTALEMAKSSPDMTPAQAEKAFMVGTKIKEALSKSYKAGVKIAFGTDMGVGPHGQNAREFALMVECGMKPADTVKAATVTASQLLDIENEAGTIAAGKSADIIAVNGNPLEDVRTLERMQFVMARGVVA
jgi:imidazolonepropionase-like amidohydrolase